MTTEPAAPYNKPVMAADDLAIAAAIRRQEERLARDPTSLAFAQLADLYRKAGRPSDAITTCRAGLQRYPHYTTARLILAKTLLAENEPSAALAEIEAILQVSPRDVQCHRLAAEAHRRLGSIDAAVQSLETAVSLDPGDRESRALLSVLRADARVAEATGVTRLLTDDTFVTPAFGEVCLEQGLADDAAVVFTRILRQDAGNMKARERLETALRARTRRKG